MPTSVEVQIRVRWADMDAYGHVNNGVYLNYLEEARDRLMDAVFPDGGAYDFVIAHVGIDYRHEITQADGEVTVRSEVTGYGRSSVRTREVIVKGDGTLSAEGECVLVARNVEAGGSRLLTDAERAILDAALG